MQCNVLCIVDEVQTKLYVLITWCVVVYMFANHSNINLTYGNYTDSEFKGWFGAHANWREKSGEKTFACSDMCMAPGSTFVGISCIV